MAGNTELKIAPFLYYSPKQSQRRSDPALNQSMDTIPAGPASAYLFNTLLLTQLQQPSFSRRNWNSAIRIKGFLFLKFVNCRRL